MTRKPYEPPRIVETDRIDELAERASEYRTPAAVERFRSAVRRARVAMGMRSVTLSELDRCRCSHTRGHHSFTSGVCLADECACAGFDRER